MFNIIKLRRRKMPTLTEEILLTLEEGIVNFLQPYHFHLGQTKPYYHPGSLYTLISRLEKRGMVRKIKRGRKNHLKLTARGKELLLKHRSASDKSRPSWDRQWRLVIFDIPEKQAALRKYLTQYLHVLGFRKVQRSVWISPFDYQKNIIRYIRKLKLSDYVFFLQVKSFAKLTHQEIADTFWDLDGLHKKYLKFQRQWSEKRIKVEKILDSSDYSDMEKTGVIRRFLRNLVWDYQTIRANDPILPRELLAKDWGGKVVEEFIRKTQKTLNTFCRSAESV